MAEIAAANLTPDEETRLTVWEEPLMVFDDQDR